MYLVARDCVLSGNSNIKNAGNYHRRRSICVQQIKYHVLVYEMIDSIWSQDVNTDDRGIASGACAGIGS